MATRKPLVRVLGRLKELPAGDSFLAGIIGDFAATVRSTLLTGLSTATNAAIAATDTVLQALGKLQAQVSGLITSSITNGDTTHAPSGDAVFDALALKYNAAGGTIAGNATVQGLFIVDRTGASAAAQHVIASDGGQVAFTRFRTGSNNRWTIGKENSSESGSDVGSNFVIQRTSDSGVEARALTIFRNSGHIQFGADNLQNLGDATHRAKEFFCGNATINPSDADEKTEPEDLTPDELAAAAEIARLPCRWQWLEAVEEKGPEKARWHMGPTVQAVIAVMQKHGLEVTDTSSRYAFICYDEWPESVEPAVYETVEITPAVTVDHPAIYERTQVYTAKGEPERFAERMVSPAWTEVVTPAVTEQRETSPERVIPAGHRYSLRPTELEAFRARGLAWEHDQLAARLAALEAT